MNTYVTVGEADDEAVLRRIVLVLRLGDQTLASIVVGLSGTSAAVLGLEAGEVRAGLDELGERLQIRMLMTVRQRIEHGDIPSWRFGLLLALVVGGDTRPMLTAGVDFRKVRGRVCWLSQQSQDC